MPACELYTESERGVLEEELWERDEAGTNSFNTLDSSERMMTILGDSHRRRSRRTAIRYAKGYVQCMEVT